MQIMFSIEIEQISSNYSGIPNRQSLLNRYILTAGLEVRLQDANALIVRGVIPYCGGGGFGDNDRRSAFERDHSEIGMEKHAESKPRMANEST